MVGFKYMSIRNVPFAKDEFYHIYNRGNSKQVIFHDKEDMDRFVSLMFISNNPKRFKTKDIKKSKTTLYETKKDTPLIAIGAYCLMPNHFHMAVTQIENNGISKFMQKLSTAYVMYYNKRYERTGGLFEGKFKSKHITTDRQLKYLFSYIHLNPVKLIDLKWKERGIKNKSATKRYLRNYLHSSYLDFLNKDSSVEKREEAGVLGLDKFPKYFPTKQAFEREVFSWFLLK